LLHLSILWRSSVFSLDEFSEVSLGPREETIHQLLLNDDPGQENRNSFFGLILHHNKKIIHDLIIKPKASRFKAHHVYVFIFGGVQWTYFTSNHSVEDLDDLMFGYSGEMILGTQAVVDNPYVKDFAEEYFLA